MRRCGGGQRGRHQRSPCPPALQPTHLDEPPLPRNPQPDVARLGLAGPAGLHVHGRRLGGWCCGRGWAAAAGDHGGLGGRLRGCRPWGPRGAAPAAQNCGTMLLEVLGRAGRAGRSGQRCASSRGCWAAWGELPCCHCSCSRLCEGVNWAGRGRRPLVRALTSPPAWTKRKAPHQSCAALCAERRSLLGSSGPSCGQLSGRSPPTRCRPPWPPSSPWIAPGRALNASMTSDGQHGGPAGGASAGGCNVAAQARRAAGRFATFAAKHCRQPAAQPHNTNTGHPRKQRVRSLASKHDMQWQSSRVT